MTLHELFAVQEDMNRLKSLYMELESHENLNPYKNNAITGMPKENRGGSFLEWYTEKRERLLKDIEFCKEKTQKDRKTLDDFIARAPYPECDIIRFRVINAMSWGEIGEALAMDRTTASKKFYNYIKFPTFPTQT